MFNILMMILDFKKYLITNYTDAELSDMGVKLD
jgi:hypothetical protein